MHDPILTRDQASLFLLLKHGLIGPYRFAAANWHTVCRPA